ncbi:R3H and coiled-coil domain-containing protein 1 [Mastacembelus armatus]|uniref:R3H domain and coiled-coil containing 1 n=1 Tax=Mastacembelus armatus TaxID=205130 RepID=A0A3Q3MVY9_9TELE|nr:R3H and coiled-coil domain-containing protein 1 [Mastacembelus armatus]
MDELEAYQKKSNHKSVLLFPPLPSRLRYLIHKTVEDLAEFTTFSIGESWYRRVVVCHSELRSETEEDSDLDSNNSLCEESLRSREEMEGFDKPKSSIPPRSRGSKRPDKPLYVPRAARQRLSMRSSQGPTVCEELSGPASGSCACISSSSDSCSCYEATENTISSTSRQEPDPILVDGILHTADGSVRCPQEELEVNLHEANPFVWDQTVSSFTNMTLEEYEKDKDDPASASYIAQTKDISTGTDDISEEIKAHLKDTLSFSIEHVHNDYSIYENMFINSDEFRHVIEIYDFPSVFKTADLLDAFMEYSDGGMKIKWVDNTHALGVFSSESAALHALSICHPLLKTRPLAEGSKKAKGKAIRRAEFIQPVKERPRTDCAVARRMVSRALGLQGRGRVQRY